MLSLSPPDFVIFPDPIVVIPEGDSTTLMCSHTSRTPAWYKGTSTRVTESTPCDCTVSGVTTIRLEFMDFQGVEGEGADVYGCWVAGVDGSFDMCSFQVQLAGKAEVGVNVFPAV